MAKRASIMDGELFFLKQLLILREQIVPFDAEFSVVEKDLDFTHMRDYLRRILAGAICIPCWSLHCAGPAMCRCTIAAVSLPFSAAHLGLH